MKLYVVVVRLYVLNLLQSKYVKAMVAFANKYPQRSRRHHWRKPRSVSNRLPRLSLGFTGSANADYVAHTLDTPFRTPSNIGEVPQRAMLLSDFSREPEVPTCHSMTPVATRQLVRTVQHSRPPHAAPRVATAMRLRAPATSDPLRNIPPHVDRLLAWSMFRGSDCDLGTVSWRLSITSYLDFHISIFKEWRQWHAEPESAARRR